MWLKNSNNQFLQLKNAVLAVVLISASASVSVARSLEIDETPERVAICAKAEARYQKMFPGAKKSDAVVVVKLHKYTFCPPNLTVKKGTTVRWVNVDKRTSHSVWLKAANIAESDRFFPEEIWQHTFTAGGAYPYLCGPHWDAEDMRGFVKVTE